MASSRDAVRNWVYDFHHYDLAQGWAVVQELDKEDLDSWESIHAAFPVGDLSKEHRWNYDDEKSVASFLMRCPKLSDKLAAQLAAQAARVVENPASPARSMKRGMTVRLGSFQQRVKRIYLKETLPFLLGKALSQKGAKTDRLVPFDEAVAHHGFLA